jgi:UTP-glucose-1-phosphate uridylyltransferase
VDKTKLKSLLISPETSIKQAIHRLNETADKILFVSDEMSRVLGTVSDGDIRRGIIAGLQMTSPVGAIMNKEFISLKSGFPDIQKQAMRLMKQHVIEQVPVLSEDGMIMDVLLWIDFLDGEKRPREKTEIMLNNPVVIMAGGKGSRLDPFTKILPKPLIPLGDKPIIEHIMDHYFENGFSNFILIINYKKEMIKAYFSEKGLPYSIEFVEETEFLGTAGGLFLLKDRIRETFVVTNCDTLLTGSNLDYFNWHKEQSNLMTIVGSHKEITVPYGVLCMNNGSLVSIDEKPKIDLFINTGTYILEPEGIDSLSASEYLDMDKFIIRLKVAYPEKIGVYPHWGRWFDLGQWDEYRKSLKEWGDV